MPRLGGPRPNDLLRQLGGAVRQTVAIHTRWTARRTAGSHISAPCVRRSALRRVDSGMPHPMLAHQRDESSPREIMRNNYRTNRRIASHTDFRCSTGANCAEARGQPCGDPAGHQEEAGRMRRCSEAKRRFRRTVCGSAAVPADSLQIGAENFGG